MRGLGDRIAGSGGKGPGQKGATIALFHWRLSKIIILSAVARISLIPWEPGGRARTAECQRKGWIAGVRCGVWSALLAPSTVSTSPNRRFCRRTYHFSSVPLTQARLFATSTSASRSTPFVVYARGVYTRNCLSPASLSLAAFYYLSPSPTPRSHCRLFPDQCFPFRMIRSIKQK